MVEWCQENPLLIELVITDSMDVSLSELPQVVMDREAQHAVIHGVTELDTTEWLNWLAENAKIDILGLVIDRFLQCHVNDAYKYFNGS